MRPEAGILDILANAGVGVIAPTPNPWPMFEGQLPADPDQCIMVRKPGGPRPEVKIAIDYPSIQVLVRSTRQGYDEASDKVEEIKLALHAIPSSPVQFPDLTSCLLAGEPAFTGYDENNRPIWSANFNCIVSKNPEGYRDL